MRLQEKVVAALQLDTSAEHLETYVLYWQMQPFMCKAALQLLFELAGTPAADAYALASTVDYP